MDQVVIESSIESRSRKSELLGVIAQLVCVCTGWLTAYAYDTFEIEEEGDGHGEGDEQGEGEGEAGECYFPKDISFAGVYLVIRLVLLCFKIPFFSHCYKDEKGCSFQACFERIIVPVVVAEWGASTFVMVAFTCGKEERFVLAHVLASIWLAGGLITVCRCITSGTFPLRWIDRFFGYTTDVFQAITSIILATNGLSDNSVIVSLIPVVLILCILAKHHWRRKDPLDDDARHDDGRSGNGDDVGYAHGDRDGRVVVYPQEPVTVVVRN